jgi:hypothetical protein
MLETLYYCKALRRLIWRHPQIQMAHAGDNNDTLNYTFILPDITCYPEDFRAFLHKDLIETTTLVSLEQAGSLALASNICYILMLNLLAPQTVLVFSSKNKKLRLRLLCHFTVPGSSLVTYWKGVPWLRLRCSQQICKGSPVE